MSGIVQLALDIPDDGSAESTDAHARRGELRAHLLAAVLREVGVDVDGPVVVVRRCAVCGSTEHGKPEVAAALAAGVHVSLAHTRNRTHVAAARGPVGVDVEEIDAVAAHPVADVLLSPGERAAGHPLDAESLTRTWVRKEALLKATGHGLHVPPSAVTLSLPGDGEPRLLAWDGPGPTPVPVEWDESLGTGLYLPTALTTAVVLASATTARTCAASYPGEPLPPRIASTRSSGPNVRTRSGNEPRKPLRETASSTVDTGSKPGT